MRLRSGLLVHANGAGPSGQVVVSWPLLRPSPQESRPCRVEANAGCNTVARFASRFADPSYYYLGGVQVQLRELEHPGRDDPFALLADERVLAVVEQEARAELK